MKRICLNFLLITMMLVGNVSTVVAASGRNSLANTSPHAQQATSSIVVSSVNFNDSTTGSWTQNGAPTLAYVDDGLGGQALSITRAADYEGIQSPTGLLEAGIEYTFSMRAMLAAGGPTSTGVRFIVKPNYNWVANTTINDTGWTTINGTYTLPAGVDPATVQIYIGSTDQTGPYTLLVDDILITRPVAVVTVSSVNFNDSTTGTWTQSGGPTLAYVDDGLGGQALSITRAADYEGIQSPTGLLEAGVEYTFSMRAMLAAGGPTSTGVRFIVKPNYNWVANTTINDTGWTTISGAYTLPAGVDPATAQIYIGSTDQTGAYTILIDDILITRPDTGGCVSNVTVANQANSGAGSLRQAIADVCTGGTIDFDNDYTITLASTLTIARNVTIDGAGHSVTVNGADTVRVFVVNSGVTATLNHLTIVNGNAGAGNGGGLYNSGTVTVMNSTLSSNNATWGGGIYNTGASTLYLMNSTLADNTATDRGGGLYNNNGGTAIVTASTLSGNRTTHTPYGNGYGGGGIYNAGTLILQTSTLADNSAPFNTGGGIYNHSTLTVQASTLSGNSADYGSGLGNQTGNVSLVQAIIANSSSGHDCGLAGGNVTSVDSLIEGDACGVSSDYNTILGIDPLLGPLADNGGSTQTFALLPGSPAIDAVKLNSCLATDQRGEERNDLGCDIGAYELKYPDSHTVIRSIDSASMTTFGPALVGIQRDATDPGAITVTKSLTWKTKPANAIDAYWFITPTVSSGFNLTLQLCYTPAELGTLAEAQLLFWRYSGGAWSQAAGTPTLSTVNGYRCATLSGINALSAWTLATGSPTAITLNDLRATSPVEANGSWWLLLGLSAIGAVMWLLRRRMT